MAGSFLAGAGALISNKQVSNQRDQSIRAERLLGAYQRQTFEMNAKIAEFQAEDAIRRGDEEANKLLTNVQKLIGSQRTATAAQGIEVDSGSALDIQLDTAALGAVDAQTIKTNAYQEAFGFKAEAYNKWRDYYYSAISQVERTKGIRTAASAQKIANVLGGSASAINSYNSTNSGSQQSSGGSTPRYNSGGGGSSNTQPRSNG